jgi:hypothetical protein
MFMLRVSLLPHRIVDIRSVGLTRRTIVRWAAGGLFDTTSILDLTTEALRKHMQVNFEPNLCECGMP